MRSEKDPNKLTSIDDDGGRIHIIPSEVRGFFRQYRSRVQLALLVIFLILPWVHYQGQQLILVNVIGKELIFFGFVFKSHDAPLIFLLLAALTLGLALVTAIWGRIWCGWACPQTVFIDAVFRRIELWTEGNYLQRRKLQSESWGIKKLRKRALKWSLFILVSAVIAHSFAAYFIGSYELLIMMKGNPSDNWNYFLLILFFTILVVFDFGWFREQFCVIMCPYGRLQSVLLEPSSLVIAYDEKRGEPRRSLNPKEQVGDCVSCNRCVEVCPTGIDIRNGLQMECIACTACVDACNEIMTKVKKPLNLIGYRTMDNLPFKVLKLKTVVYGLLIFSSLATLAFSLKTREPVHIAVLRGIGEPYTRVTNSAGQLEITNHFRLHLTSQSDIDRIYEVKLSEKDISRNVVLIPSRNPLLLKSSSAETWHMFVRAPESLLPKDGKTEITILIVDQGGTVISRTFTFIGPAK